MKQQDKKLNAKGEVLEKRSTPQKIAKFVRIGLYGLAIVAVIAFMVKTEFWIFGVAVLGLAYMLPRLRKRNSRLFEAEQSARLRQIAFGAQVAGTLALAWPTRLWVVAIISIALLALGHRTAYRMRNKPPKWLRVVTFVGLHLVFGWMFVGLVRWTTLSTGAGRDVSDGGGELRTVSTAEFVFWHGNRPD